MPKTTDAMSSVAPTTCPVCRRTVTPDRFGRLACQCGWSGPGDPLEAARGLSRFFTGLDRRLANRLAVRNLTSIESGRLFHSLNFFYRLILIVFSTIIYLIIGALFVGSIAIIVSFGRDGAWLGVLVGLFLLGLLIYALAHGHVSVHGITANHGRFPNLFAVLDEIRTRTGSKAPHRVILTSNGSFFVYQHHPLRRLLLPERVLAIGVASLSMMNEEEAKATLAHELAHYRNLDTTFHRYYAIADVSLGYILRVVQEAMADANRPQARNRFRNRYSGNPLGFAFMILVPIVWLLLLPLRLFWGALHLLRLAESRRAEFLADRLAVQNYGGEAFIGGLTNVVNTMRRLNRSTDGVVAEMRRTNTSNYYVTQRNYYAELPEQYRNQLTSEALQDFPSLVDSHPTLRERFIAARMQDPGNALVNEGSQPATRLIIPQGESTSDSVEIELSKQLLAERSKGRR